jgi:hypothetical protein
MHLKLFQTVCAVSSFVVLLLILELIRRRRIQDTLWIPWLAVAITPAVVGIWITPWATTAHWLGVIYEPMVLVGFSALMSFGMLLYLSVVVSSLLRQNLKFAQEIALLKDTVDELTKTISGNR